MPTATDDIEMKDNEEIMEDAAPALEEIEEIPRLSRELSVEVTNPKSLGLPASSGWFAGNGTFGQLGHGTNTDAMFPIPLVMQGSAAPMQIARIAVGSSHTIAVSPDGGAFCFGLNDSGQCAIRSAAADVVLSPLQTNMENDVYIRSSKVVDVACGGQHTAAITDDGELVTWGNSERGQCGHDNTSNAFTPRLVRALKSHFVSQVACGDSHTLILTNTSQVLSCGLAMYHALGHGNDIDVKTPTTIRALWSLPVIQIAAGEHHSAALLSTGVLYLWGRNNQGQAGMSAPSLEAAELGGINQNMLSTLLEMGYKQRAAEEALIRTKNGGVDACVDWLHANSKESSPSVQKLPARCAGLSRVDFVACGGNHNVAVAGDSVFSWGAGGSGQLGHGRKEDEFAPREVAALAGKDVCEASCGYAHTLFPLRRPPAETSDEQPMPGTDEGQLYCCGSNEFGQLLLGEASAESLEVVDVSAALAESLRGSMSCSPAGPARHPQRLQVRTMAAGGQTSAVTVGVEPNSPPVSRMQHFALLGHMAITKLHKLIHGAATGAEGEAEELREQTQRLFRSSAALTAVCADESGDGVRFESLEQLYVALLPALGPSGTPGLVEAISFLLKDMIDHLSISSPSSAVVGAEASPLGTTSCARAALAVAQNPLMDHAVLGGSLLTALCKVLNLLDRATTQQLVVWWSKCPPHILLRRIVQPLNSRLSKHLEQTQTLDEHVIHAVIVLDLAHRATLLSASPLIETCFVNDYISNHMPLERDYVRWRQAVGVLSSHPDQDPYPIHRQNFSFCSFSFLLSESAKAQLLHVEAQIMQQQEQMMSMGGVLALFHSESIPASMQSSEPVARSTPNKRAASNSAPTSDEHLPTPGDSGLPATHPAYCILRLRRSALLQDALHEICRQKTRDLFKPLKVVFLGEEGVDEGGLTKEFFALITERLFDPAYGMFQLQEETGVLWFNPASLGSDSCTDFMIVGLLMSLAVYNHVLLDVPFPRVLWKKLLGKPLNQADLSDLSPEVADGLQKLLEYDGPGSVEEVFCLTFEAGYNFCGEQHSLELKPHGKNIPVTNLNRREYVQLYVDHILSSSIKTQFEAFRSGFLTLFHPTGLLRLLSPRELEVLVCGSPALDFYKLQHVAQYGAGYTAQSTVIEWFWQVVHEMSEEDKKKLLKFVTGNDRSPIGGLSKLQFVIQRQGPDSMQLPTSHTCFNVLLLPEYTSRGKLRDRVMTAIANAEGFGLQ